MANIFFRYARIKEEDKLGNTTITNKSKVVLKESVEIEKEETQPSLIDWKTIWKPLSIIVGGFIIFFWLPIGNSRFNGAVIEALALAKWYAQEHVILCLVPAFFIAGAIACFVSQAAVMKYLGAGAKKVLAYGVASVSGSILAVCSCTVLPLFASIWKRGAGLGPAIAFLYSGPAINILAIVLTARVLGLPIGIARAIGAIIFSIVIGLIMHFLFRKEEEAKAQAAMHMPEPEVERPLWQNTIYFAVMVFILISATWGKPGEPTGLWHAIYSIKWMMTGFFALILGVLLVIWFKVKAYKVGLAGAAVLVLALLFPHEPLIAFSAGIIGLVWMITTTRGETENWFLSSWDFTKADHAAALCRGSGSRSPSGTTRFRRPYLVKVGKQPCGRELPVGKSFCFSCRRIHVLCHTHGGADFTRAPWFRHGPGAGPGAAPCRACFEPAEHAGDPKCAGHQEDHCLHHPGRHYGHHQRNDLRAFFYIEDNLFSH